LKTKKILILIFTVYLTNIVNAAAPPPPSGGGKPGCWPPPCVPIDGGISLLIAAGAIYGGKKLYSSKKEKNSL
jgi:hypothetical protein